MTVLNKIHQGGWGTGRRQEWRVSSPDHQVLLAGHCFVHTLDFDISYIHVMPWIGKYWKSPQLLKINVLSFWHAYHAFKLWKLRSPRQENINMDDKIRSPHHNWNHVKWCNCHSAVVALWVMSLPLQQKATVLAESYTFHLCSSLSTDSSNVYL